MKPTPVDLATLGTVDPTHAGPLAIRLLDMLQKYPLNEQAAALSIAFVLLCRKLDVRPSYLMQTASNILSKSLRFLPEIRACKMYVDEHLCTRS